MLYEAIRGDAPWTRVALAVERNEQGRRELRAMAAAARRLAHPGIAALVDDSSDAATPMVALAWCAGSRLDAVIATLSADQRLDVAIQIAELVAHAHAHGVVLRDLKPSNLLIAPGAVPVRGEPRATLVDLELARVVPLEPGRPAGTWRWTAPEQAVLDAAEIDARSDVYALGTTLYFVFAARPLFSEGSQAIVEQLAGERVAGCQAELPEAIGPIVRACLERDRCDRLAASSVAALLRGVAGAAPATAPPATAPAAKVQHAPDVAATTLDEIAAALAGTGVAAAEARLRIHDPARAAALAAEVLAHDPGDVRALACLARARADIRSANAAEALDRLDALAVDDLDAARRASAIEAELLTGRPRRALRWAHRAPAPARDAALESLVTVAREWLCEVDRLDDAARLAWQVDAPRGDAPRAVRRSLGAALILLGRRDDDDAAAAVRDVRAALDDERAVVETLPLEDLAVRGPDAAPVCTALLLHLEGLDDAALAVPLADPIDAARVALIAGRPDDARRSIDARSESGGRGERAAPSRLAVHVRALALLDAGRSDEAVDALSAAHAADPAPETARWLCCALLRAGRAVEACAILEAAQLPSSAWLARTRIAALVGSNRTADAIAACEAAGTSDATAALARAVTAELDRRGPRAPVGWQDVPRIRALVRTGLAAGRHDLVRAVHAEVGTLETLDLLIATCRARGTPEAAEEAVTACRDAFDAHPCGKHALRLIEVLATVGAGDAAERLLGTWVDLAPDDAGIWCAAAHRLLAARQWEQAAVAAARARALEPHNRDAAACAMIAALERGDAAQALALAREAVAAWPRGEVAWDVLLEAEQVLGTDPSSMIAHTRDALRACPDSVRLLQRLTAALAGAGRLDEALAAQRDALAAAPRNTALWADRARLLLAGGRAVEALQVAHALERIAGAVPEVGAIQMWAWLALGSPAHAIEAGTAIVAAEAAGPALWEGLALAWLATGALSDARNALAMMQQAGGRADRGARLALAIALAGDAASDIVREIADDALALDPRDPDLAFLAAIARLAHGDPSSAERSFEALLRDLDWAPRLDTRIALAAVSEQAAAAIERALEDGDRTQHDLRGALAWAGALWLIARDRAAAASELVSRAGETAALRVVAAEAALRAGDATGLRALATRLTPDERAGLGARLARRMGAASRV